MTDALIALVPEYGFWLIGLTTFFSCLAFPVPASLIMITGGAFAAGGDMTFITTATTALTGAIFGDQLGFAIGRFGFGHFRRDPEIHSGKKSVLKRARDFFLKWGQSGVFFSRWLVSPLGPYVNFIGGATGLNWRVFTVYAAAGEVIWVGIYTGLGYSFSGQIMMIANLASNASGFIVALVVSVGLGHILLRTTKKH